MPDQARTNTITKDDSNTKSKTATDASKNKASDNKKVIASTIGEVAVSLAWKLGTKQHVKSYPGGAPTKEFKKALNTVKGDYHFWSDHSSKGASCDVFVATCVRYSGYDKDFPFGITKWDAHLKNSKKWKRVKYDPHKSPKNQLMSGDLMLLRRHGGYKHAEPSPSHVCMVVKVNGKFRTAEAQARSEYGAIEKFKSGAPYKWVKIYRATDPDYAGGNVTADMFFSDGEDSDYFVDNGGPLVLKENIAELYSTGNYSWTSSNEDEDPIKKAIREKQNSVRTYLQNVQMGGRKSEEPQFYTDVSNSITPTDVVVTPTLSPMESSKEFVFKIDKYKNKSGRGLSVYPNLVEAPTVELSFNGIVIGGYNNVGDKYPNYITSMTVSKINGRINTYNINLVYQVRPNEDPNFIDSLISKTGYLNPLKIRYGDSNSPGLYYKEEHAVITNVDSKADVSSMSINYSITAISSILSSEQTYHNFIERIDKPSNIIDDLLYRSGNISTQIQNAFPLMSNKSYVNSNNLIPSNDIPVVVGGMTNVSPLVYLGHVVSCMTNDIRSSSYFLTYNDTADGAYFKISEVTANSILNSVYEVDVGYPENDFVLNFQLCDNMYWPLIYDYNGRIPKWEYDIDNTGNIIRSQTNSLYTDNKYMETSIINSNWWNSVTEFPISAKLTLKGLTAPLMLMTYIRIDTLFYGQKDLASGLYVVTNQEDSISGNGCTTTLTLLRVND